MFTQLTKQLQVICQHTLDVVYPPRCLLCVESVDCQGHLCHECWQKLEFLAGAKCYRCGIALPYEVEPESVCAKCHLTPPSYSRARAPLRYNSVAKQLISHFKYYDQLHLYKALASWMVMLGQDLLSSTDLLIPVPLYRLRLWRRRYNQAAILANEISRQSDVPVVNHVLLRIKPTAPQVTLPRKKRLKNVRTAFAIDPKYQYRLKEKHVVLIDDVMTTEATVNACSQILLMAGAKQVDVLTLARRDSKYV